jgi:hypothetical protein
MVLMKNEGVLAALISNTATLQARITIAGLMINLSTNRIPGGPRILQLTEEKDMKLFLAFTRSFIRRAKEERSLTGML